MTSDTNRPTTATSYFPEEHGDLVRDFNAHFGKTLTYEVISRLLGSGPFRGWYETWKRERATALSLPDHWRDAGLTPADWQEAMAGMARRRDRRRKFADESSTLARDFDRKLKEAEARLEADLRSMETPVALVVEIGYADLDADALVRVETLTGEARESQLETEISALRKASVQALKQGRPLPLKGKLGGPSGI